MRRIDPVRRARAKRAQERRDAANAVARRLVPPPITGAQRKPIAERLMAEHDATLEARLRAEGVI